jgi:hypothetical protein
LKIGKAVLDIVEAAISSIMEVVQVILVLLGVYIGWKFMMAADEGKRTQAKMQLIYTVIALAAIVLISVLSGVVIAGLAKQVG